MAVTALSMPELVRNFIVGDGQHECNCSHYRSAGLQRRSEMTKVIILLPMVQVIRKDTDMDPDEHYERLSNDQVTATFDEW